MELSEIMSLRNKLEELARNPSFTEIQRAFIAQVSEEMRRIMLARQAGGAVHASVDQELESIRQYIASLRPFLRGS